jgi:glycosyltransferase involved in cell wall biosynthesis
MNPLFSIVIPTRCRPETLFFALKSALDQDFSDFEVIVSDNFSNDETTKVINSFKDKRLRYVNTGKRLSMCDNWEFALQHVEGRYAIFIGDDDAIIPGALEKLSKAISETGYADCYMWPTITYWWPIDENPPWVTNIPLELIKNRLKTGIKKSLRVEDNIKGLAFKSIRHGFWRYSQLPMSYHNAISVDIYRQISASAGRVFHSNAPDFITFFEFPVFAKTLVRLPEPASIFGVSGKSNGGSGVAKNGSSVVRTFIEEYGDYKFHHLLPDCMDINHKMYMDPFLVPLELFKDFYKNVPVNYSAMIAFMRRQGFIKRNFVYKNLHDFFSKRRSLINSKFSNTKRLVEFENIYDFVKFLRSELDRWIEIKN